MTRSPALRDAVAPGAAAGLIGGVAFGAAMVDLGLLESIASLIRADTSAIGFAVHLVVAVVLGIGFGLLVWFQRPEPGETVFWGMTYGAMWWFVGALTLLPLLSGEPVAWDIETARDLVPALIGHLVYGAVAGIVLMLVRRPPGADRRRIPTLGALIRGAIAGVIGAALVTPILDSQLGQPSVAVSMTDNSRPAAWLVALAVGVVAGVGFALLYADGARGAGPALVRGMVYGFLLWVVFALTLLPVLDGDGLQWEVADVRAGFETLPGYVLFLGALLAFGYQALTGAQRALFGDDHAARSREGVGTQGIRAVGRGALAGLVGGFVFTIVMVQIGFLSTVSRLIDRESPITGFVLHLLIAVLIGMLYGLLFVRRSNDPSSALGWGTAYGAFWWLMGPLTLLPLLLGESPQWTVEAVTDAYPALVGHLGYGAFLGVAYFRLEARHNPWWIPRNEAEAARARRASEQLLGSAPALWVLNVLIALTIPLLLAA